MSINLKGYSIINLDDMLAELGEDRVKSILSDFSCPLNKDVEQFLADKAIEFSHKGLSKTHLVFCSYKKKITLIGYFTLAVKFINLGKHALSNSLRKRIAQLGKNFKYADAHLITGDEL